MDDYREDLAYQHTKALTQWYRYIGSEGESKARQYIFSQFTGLGIECKREPFKCSNFLAKYVLRIGVTVAGIILMLSAFFYWQSLFIHSFVVALALVACLPLINLMMASTSAGSSLGQQFESENLVGYLKASNPNPKRTVFIMSHYDSKTQTFPVIYRILLYTLGLFGGLTIILLIVISNIIYFLNSTIFIPRNVIFIGAIIFFVCLLLIDFNMTHNKTVGATDNAAAVGIQTAIIRDLLDFPPENTDVYFLATSAEEIGLLGAVAFIERHENELNKDSTYFINYDVIGAEGKLVLHTKYGIPPKTTSNEINELLLEIAKEKNLEVGTQYLPTGAMADHFPILKRGFKTTWIQSGNKSVVWKKIHTPNDNMDLINKESLRAAIILGFEFVQRIDKKP